MLDIASVHGGSVAEAQRLSKTYRQGAKGARTPAAVLCWLLGLALTARAQESIYSANSLIATFESGSRVALKGTEIVFRDVVAETRISKVIFKSSQSDRIICELVPSAKHGNQAAVGSVLKVKGRVRGRGLLGNVTLDDCNIAPAEESAAAAATPETVLEEPASAEPEVIPEAALPAETLPPVSVADQTPSIAKHLAPRPVAPRAAVDPGPVERAPSLTAVRDHADNSIQPTSESQSRVLYGLYVLIFLAGAGASLILSKLLRPATPPGPAVRENTSEVRQAALEALLLKAEKKK